MLFFTRRVKPSEVWSLIWIVILSLSVDVGRGFAGWMAAKREGMPVGFDELAVLGSPR